MAERGLHLIRAPGSQLNGLSVPIGVTTRVWVLLCAVFLCNLLWASCCTSLHAGCIRLAELEQTKDSVIYGTDEDQGESLDFSAGDNSQSGVQDRNGYIEYQAGPTRQEKEARKWQEAEKEAASMDMLQNMFIGIDARRPRGSYNEPPSQ